MEGCVWTGTAIPADKRAHASAAFGFPDGNASYLYDDTFWGGADNGILIGHEGVGIRFNDAEPFRFRWLQIDAVFRHGSHIDLLAEGWLVHLNAATAPPVESFFDACDKLAELDTSPLGQLLESVAQSGEPDAVSPQAVADARALHSRLEEFRLDTVQPSRSSSLEETLDSVRIVADGKVVLRPVALAQLVIEEARLQTLFDPETSQRRLDELASLLRARLAAGSEDELWLHLAIERPLVELTSDYLKRDLPPDSAEALRQFVRKHGNKEERDEADRRLATTVDQRRAYFEGLAPERRRVLLCTDAVADWPTDALRAIRGSELSTLPWRFPLGHPDSDELYVVHPLRRDTYVPLEDFHHRMFQDRYIELQRLLAALGATQIEIDATEGAAMELFGSGASAGRVSDGVFTGLSGSGATATESDTRASQRRGLTLSLKLAPSARAHVPEGLVWYQHEPTWQAIAREALDGRVHEYAVELRYAEDFSVNEKLKGKLQGELKLFGGKVKGGVDMESESFVRELKNSRVRVLVRFPDRAPSPRPPAFPSMEPATKPLGPDAGDAELAYLEDYADIMVSGAVTDGARRLLRRTQARLGLDDTAVARLEAGANARAKLTQSEREYVEDVLDCVEGGGLTTEARRLLTRHAQKLGLSTERAGQLDALAQSGAVRRERG